MALINDRRQVVEDLWTYPDPEGRESIAAYHVLSLDALTSLGSERPVGAYAPAGTTADRLAPFLDRLDLVVVEFPKFRDGRGFTLARTLRARYGFPGDIRAIGHVLPDQFTALVQCGVSSIVLPAGHPPAQWVQDLRPSGGPLLQRLLSGQAAAGKS